MFASLSLSLSLSLSQGIKNLSGVLDFEERVNKRRFASDGLGQYVASKILSWQWSTILEVEPKIRFHDHILSLKLMLTSRWYGYSLLEGSTELAGPSTQVLMDIAKHLPCKMAGSRFVKLMTPGKKAKTHHYFMLAGE